MRYRRTAFALVLTLGLASISFPAHAQKDEGSMSEQEAHDMKDKQIRESRKQEAGAKDEAEKETAMDQGTPRARHDSPGGHNESREQMEEGSH